MSTELEAINVDEPAAPASPGSPDSPAAPAVPVKTPAEEWAELPKMFGSIISAFKPLRELQDVYTDAACREWGEAMAPIAAERGWTAAGALAWLGPWVRLAVASHVLLQPTADLIRQRLAEAKAAKAAAAAAAEKGNTTPAQ